jgi:hypothetical protein
MGTQTSATSEPRPENHPPEKDDSENKFDTYELASTLNGYKVEEVAIHDLAHFLPTLILTENRQDELQPTLDP